MNCAKALTGVAAISVAVAGLWVVIELGPAALIAGFATTAVGIVVVVASYFAAGALGGAAYFVLQRLPSSYLRQVIVAFVLGAIGFGTVWFAGTLAYELLSLNILDARSPEEAWRLLPYVSLIGAGSAALVGPLLWRATRSISRESKIMRSQPIVMVAGHGNVRTFFKKLNEGWNAEPNVPDERVFVDGSDVVLEFVLNGSFPEGQRGHLLFRGTKRFLLSSINDHAFLLGQCRFSRLAPEWGEFYEVSGDLLLDQSPPGWQDLAVSSPGPGKHFLFYMRDSTFECQAESWEFVPHEWPGWTSPREQLPW